MIYCTSSFSVPLPHCGWW